MQSHQLAGFVVLQNGARSISLLFSLWGVRKAVAAAARITTPPIAVAALSNPVSKICRTTCF